MLPEDLKQLLHAFNAHGVEYLIVGGYAVGVYAEPRATEDLDLFIRSDLKNSEAVFHALAEFGTPLEGITPADFRNSPTSVFQIGKAPGRVDIPQAIEPSRSMRHGNCVQKPRSLAWRLTSFPLNT